MKAQLEAARRAPREPLRLRTAGPERKPLGAAVLLVGARENRRSLFLFAGDRLQLGRQMPREGDPEPNDVVVRALAPSGCSRT